MCRRRKSGSFSVLFLWFKKNEAYAVIKTPCASLICHLRPPDKPTINTNTAMHKPVRKRKRRKRLSARSKKSVVLDAMASVEVDKLSRGQEDPRKEVHVKSSDTTMSAKPSIIADAGAQDNLGKAWRKDELGKLVRLIEDRRFLMTTIPSHPDTPELDWELISSHFKRWSKGGHSVKRQYYSIVRLMKEARLEGRRGSNYVDLVIKALSELPEKRGTILDIHRQLKTHHATQLDKYKVNGKVRWKQAVGEVLRQEQAAFKSLGKTTTGKIVWQLCSAL